MLRRLVGYLWLFTLTMALPTQSLAYLQQAENEATARLSFHTNSFIPQSKAEFQALSDDTRQPPDPKPVTKGNLSKDWLAIITANRWLNAPRTLDDGESSSSGERYQYEPAVSVLFRLYRCANIQASFGLCHRYFSSYRISGWKESNALYVALNGQYPAIS